MLETDFLYRAMEFSAILALFGCSWWGWFTTWTWWCRSLRKIFAQENIEMTTQRNTKTKAILMLMRKSRKMDWSATITPVNQKQMIAIRIRLRVTTCLYPCLYLGPNDRVRSLSILMAVNVKIDTPQRIRAATVCVTTAYSIPLEQWSAIKGSVITPTQRSVTARHWNNSFVGGWTEDTLRRAIRIRPLPRHAEMERKCSKRRKR